MEKKYQLQEVEELNQIGFQFEHNTIKDALTYIEKFTQLNKKKLKNLFYPGMNAKKYKELQKYYDVDNSESVIEFVELKLRISRGEIRKQDYMWIVPPWLRDDAAVLIKVHQKRLEKYLIDTELAYYDCYYLAIPKNKAKELVLYNKVLQLIIKSLPKNPFGIIPIDTTISEYERIKHSIFLLKEKASRFSQNGNMLLARACFHNIKNMEYDLYEALFSNKRSVLTKAMNSLQAVLHFGPRTRSPKFTSIEDKENIILQYLKLQADGVRTSNNTRGTGINKTKKQMVIEYQIDNPDASISEIARQCNMDRKTVRKYLNA